MPKISGVHIFAPTTQRFTTGSGTYTTPANTKYIKVTLIGGGGGGAGGSNAGGSGGDGVATTFGTSLLTGSGGIGAIGGTDRGFAGGAGGAATINSPATGSALSGTAGGVGNAGDSTYTGVSVPRVVLDYLALAAVAQ